MNLLENKPAITTYHYNDLLNQINEGFCIVKLIFDEFKKPVDYLFVEINNAFIELIGINTLGKTAKELFPLLEDYWFELYGGVALTGKSIQFENEAKQFNGIYKVSAYRIGNPNDHLVAIIFSDISRQKLAEDNFVKSQEKYKNTLDNMIEGCAIIDFNWNFLYANATYAQHCHKTIEEIIGNNLLDVVPGVENSIFYEYHKRTMEERISLQVESKFVFADGYEAWYLAIGHPVPEGIFLLTMEITERKKSEEKLINTLFELKLSQEKLLKAQKIAKIGNVEVDLINNSLSISDEIYDMFELPREDGIPKYKDVINMIHPEDKERVLSILNNVDMKDAEIDFRIILPNSNEKYIAYNIHPIYESGLVIKRIGTIQDITERKLLEISLQDKINEKELLIRELYHRTKNNMQLISSLLGLRLSVSTDPAVKNVFQEMQSRIRSIALIHDNLYKSNNLSKLNIKEYIKELVELLLDRHATSDNISIKYDLDDINLIIDTSLACGLIITELVLNSLKHAFPADHDGNIEIKLKKSEENIELVISDNGIGLNENNSNKMDTLGLLIFKSLAEDQLNAKISLDTSLGLGTTWKLQFQDAHYKERV